MQAVGQAEDAIKALTVAGPDDTLWQQTIQPVESFEIRPLAVTLNDAVKLALTNRSEIRAYGLQKEMNDVEVKYLRNQTKPQVDLVTSYGVVGAGGSVAYFPDQNGVLQPANVAPEFIGGYGTALGNLAKNSFPTWRVGVNISLPLHNRMAQANLGHALETDRQIETQMRKELQAIEVEVRTAYRAADVARLRSDAAHAARQYAEQQLSGEQEKFAAGLSTTFLVLTRQNDLSQARGAMPGAPGAKTFCVAMLRPYSFTIYLSNERTASRNVAQPNRIEAITRGFPSPPGESYSDKFGAWAN